MTDFKHQMVELANKFVDVHLTKDEVEKLFSETDIVVGVFQDETQPDGIGIYPIKGVVDLEYCSRSGFNIERKIAAFPCREYEEAVAMFQVFGDGASLN